MQLNLSELAKRCSLDVEQLSERIETVRRQRGGHLRVPAGSESYWLSLDTAEQLLAELYLS